MFQEFVLFSIYVLLDGVLKVHGNIFNILDTPATSNTMPFGDMMKSSNLPENNTVILSSDSLTSSTATSNATLLSGGKSAEEESFFSQTAPASNVDSKKPLTTDSIMALFNQNPPPSAGQPYQNNVTSPVASTGAQYSLPGQLGGLSYQVSPSAQQMGQFPGARIPNIQQSPLTMQNQANMAAGEYFIAYF